MYMCIYIYIYIRNNQLESVVDLTDRFLTDFSKVNILSKFLPILRCQNLG